MLDNQSRIPLYHQLIDFIAAQIHSGAWRAGDRIPSEGDLGMQFNISRTTVRTALGELENQGLLTRVQGKGTFVAHPRIHQRLNRLTGFTTDMQTRRLQPSSRVLIAQDVPVPPKVAQPLQVTPGSLVIMLQRLRLADGTPMAVETAYLHGDFCPGLLSDDLSDKSLYEVLSTRFKVLPARAVQELEAMACPGQEARLLNIHKGSPVLHIFRTTYDQDDRPFERVESYYRGDRYIFYAELTQE
ncbi:MAG TPA: GntR family transcriptional regulator [Anaerolineaceae bacterium]|nr:GntR family transcriptional regulator [Anaerolineaceae bacterium]